MQVFDPGLLCSSFLSSQWHCKAYDIISLVDVINPNSKWGSCSVLTAANHSTLYPKKVNTLSLLQIIPSQVKVTMFDEVMWTWVSYFPVFLGISRYFPVFPTALGNTPISRFIDNPGCKMKVWLFTFSHLSTVARSIMHDNTVSVHAV